MRKQPDPKCEYCGGTGKTYLPAHQQGGDIVDEQEQDCLCTLQDDEDMDDDSDNDVGGSIGVRPWNPDRPPTPSPYGIGAPVLTLNN